MLQRDNKLQTMRLAISRMHRSCVELFRFVDWVQVCGINQSHLEITVKVVGIIDGDTIDILTAEKSTIRVRLNDIDAPETGQPFGKSAKQFLSEKIGGQVVRVVTHGEDRYGRTIGDVFMKDAPGPNFLPGTVLPDWNINREIVQEGLAWHFKKYSSDINLEMDEITAKDRKLGVWPDPRGIPPSEWRKLSKEERDKLR